MVLTKDENHSLALPGNLDSHSPALVGSDDIQSMAVWMYPGISSSLARKLPIWKANPPNRFTHSEILAWFVGSPSQLATFSMTIARLSQASVDPRLVPNRMLMTDPAMRAMSSRISNTVPRMWAAF